MRPVTAPAPRSRARRRATGAVPASVPVLLAVAVAVSLAGCTGATVGSGVGDARLEHAPYYAGRTADADGGPGGPSIAYAPVVFQRGATVPATFDLEAEDGMAVATLLAALNAYLDSLAVGRLHGPVALQAGTPPDVQFGCDTDAIDECVLDDEGGLYRPGKARMRLAVARPSAHWATAAAEAMGEAGADAIVVITLEVGQYWPRQTSWRGSKAVELGSDRTVSLPWLTALDAPVQVIQLTGALVGRDGKAIRIGAEGLRARRTPIVASGFGLQALIGEEDVEALLAERLEDEPGRPLVWQVALRTLVAGLTGARLDA